MAVYCYLPLGMFMIAGGFSLSSEFVGRQFTEDGSIGPSSRHAYLWIQSISVSLGTLSVLAALLLSDFQSKILEDLDDCPSCSSPPYASSVTDI